jgi:hypothetical protein
MHIHSLKRAAIAACAFAVLVASSAAADPVTTQLRVEADDGRDIGPGFHYVHDSVSYRTSESAACNGSGDRGSISGPSALGVLIQAADFTRALRPVQISDQFDFGPFVCGVGGYESSDTAFWLYKVDHVAPEVGGDQFAIERSHDEVLWYFVNTATGANTGNELELVLAKNVVKAGRPTKVVVREYDPSGASTPAEGVRLMGASDAMTDENGTASVIFEFAGKPAIRGVRGNDIPTDVEHLCVWEQTASECDKWLTGWIVGTKRADRIRGTANPERIAGRRGPDRIRSRGDGEADSVRCGRGDDVVRADKLDRVRRSCETVRRK